MTVKDRDTRLNDLLTAFPTNTKGQITADVLRGQQADDIDSSNSLVTIETAVDYVVQPYDDYVISAGGNTITLPATTINRIVIKNDGAVNDTIDGNGNSVENGTTVSPGQARAFVLSSTGYVEVT